MYKHICLLLGLLHAKIVPIFKQDAIRGQRLRFPYHSIVIS